MSRLSGRKLLLTRSAEDSAGWADALAAEGAKPVVLPCIETEMADGEDLKAALAEAARHADWIVFTSRRGVDAFVALIGTHLSATIRLAAVGNSTAEKIEETFGRVDLTGSGTADALAEELANDTSITQGAHCVLALAANAGDVLERRLTEAGAFVARFNVYRTVPMKPIQPRHALSSFGCDTVIFASPSAVTGFDNQVNVDEAGAFVTIGPSTSAAVRDHDWVVAAEARQPNLHGIVDCLLETEHV